MVASVATFVASERFDYLRLHWALAHPRQASYRQQWRVLMVKENHAQSELLIIIILVCLLKFRSLLL